MILIIENADPGKGLRNNKVRNAAVRTAAAQPMGI